MFTVESISFIFFAIAAILVYLSYGKGRRKYPPGPTGLPIIGNLLVVGDRIHLVLQQYVKIYGTIFSIRLAYEKAVVLHGVKLLKEAYNHPAFCGRPVREAVGLFLSGNKAGIVFGEGPSWLAQRRFTIRHLRDFGFGKARLEGTIMDEVTELVNFVEAQNGKAIDLQRRFSLAVVNVLWTVLCGKRFAQDDPKLIGIFDQLETMINGVLGGKGKSVVINFFPRIAKIFPNWSGWNFLLKSLEPRQKLFRETIEEHKRTLQKDHDRDFIDVYLKEVQKTTDPKSCFHESNADNALESVMADFFLAGSNTTSVSLHWAVLYLLHYPEIQAKIQNELDRVVGKSRWPSLGDRNSLPYTESFIMELTRITSIISFGAPHVVTEDVEFHGYSIPKRTAVYCSLYSTHYDPEVWVDPKNFRPERFLSQDGTRAVRHESLIPFSIGKRACPGEGLAKDQLFLFITALAQRFHIVPEPGNPKPTLDVRFGQCLLEAFPYKAVFNARL